MYISELYEKELQYTCQRFSNNSQPKFTDAELMTVYLFVIAKEQRFQIKQFHRFTKDYMLSWFPKLPSYQACNHRLNHMSETFKFLAIWFRKMNNRLCRQWKRVWDRKARKGNYLIITGLDLLSLEVLLNTSSFWYDIYPNKQNYKTLWNRQFQSNISADGGGFLKEI